MIELDRESRRAKVLVASDQLSLAICKRGQNVRLASKLTKWHLDVISETRYSEAMQDGYDSLVSLPDVGISLADALYEKGFFSANELSKASVEDLIQIRDVTEEKAIQLIEAGKEYILNPDQADETSKEATLKEIDDDNDISDVSDPPEASEDQTGSDEDVAKQTVVSDDKEADSAEKQNEDPDK